MADSGTYTTDTLTRRAVLAQQLLKEGIDTSPIRSPWQGAARMAQALVGGLALRKDTEQQSAAYAPLAAMLTGGNSPSPASSPASPSPGPMGSLASMDASTPRGYRNNNPLNIEAGSFTQGQPGYSGSDGRFAKFASLDQGTQAANKLLDVYQNKYGLNTPAGIIGRWAPASDGNNVNAYAADVSKRLGIDPNSQIPPEMRPQLINAMAQHENGQPMPQMASANPQAAPQQPPQQMAQATPPAAQPQQSNPRSTIAQMLQSKNPYEQRLAAQMAGPLLQQMFAPPEFKTMQSWLGGQHGVWVNPYNQTVIPATAGAAQGAPQPQGQPQIPAQGQAQQRGRPTIDNFNPNMVNPDLKGWDYLKQYPPEVESAARAFMNGDVMPSGNPRNNGIATVAKMAAQKVAADLGNPNLADDSLYSTRRQMRTEIGKSSPNSMGGILSNGKSAFGHLATLSDNYAAQHNYNGPDMPGGGLMANAGNFITNHLGTSSTLGQIAQTNDNALKYGQEATKFYAGTGGGEAERMNAMKAINPATASSNEMAGLLQSERDLMVKRMQEKESQIKETLGPDYLNAHPVFTPELKGEIAKIDGNIAKLRSGSGPQQQRGEATSNASPSKDGWGELKVH